MFEYFVPLLDIDIIRPSASNSADGGKVAVTDVDASWRAATRALLQPLWRCVTPQDIERSGAGGLDGMLNVNFVEPTRDERNRIGMVRAARILADPNQKLPDVTSIGEDASLISKLLEGAPVHVGFNGMMITARCALVADTALYQYHAGQKVEPVSPESSMRMVPAPGLS